MASLPTLLKQAGHLRGWKQPGNIDLLRRPSVPNPEVGGMSTVYSMAIGTDAGTVLIPRISPEGAFLSPQEAIQRYRETGQHLGVYEDQYAADVAAERIHEQQAASGKMWPIADSPLPEDDSYDMGSLGALANLKKRPR